MFDYVRYPLMTVVRSVGLSDPLAVPQVALSYLQINIDSDSVNHWWSRICLPKDSDSLCQLSDYTTTRFPTKQFICKRK